MQKFIVFPYTSAEQLSPTELKMSKVNTIMEFITIDNKITQHEKYFQADCQNCALDSNLFTSSRLLEKL